MIKSDIKCMWIVGVIQYLESQKYILIILLSPHEPWRIGYLTFSNIDRYTDYSSIEF